MKIEEFKQRLGKNIKFVRENGSINGSLKVESMTKAELSRKADIDYRTLERIENGEHSPTSYNLYQIAKVLGVSIDRLIR